MSSTALKILALVTLVLAVGLGYVAYRMSQGISHQQEAVGQAGAEGQPASKMAVVAVKPITAFTAIPADAVVVVPVAVLPEQYYTRLDEVVGHAPLADIGVGVTLTKRYFQESNSLVSSIPAGYQAMSMEINDVIAVGGFVRPGDLVDVLLYIRSTGTEVEDSQSRVLLHDARVLAYEDRVLNEVQSDNPANDQQKQLQRRIRTAVLAVPEADTTRVMLGASLGELRLALRPAEHAQEQTAGETQGDEVQIGTMGSAPPSEVEMQAVAAPEDEKVITLRELAGLKKSRARSGSAGPAGPAEGGVIIYRGSKVETVGQ